MICAAPRGCWWLNTVLAQAERDYRDRCLSTSRHAQVQRTRTRAQALPAWPTFVSPVVLLRNGDDAWPRTTLVNLSGGAGS